MPCCRDIPPRPRQIHENPPLSPFAAIRQRPSLTGRCIWRISYWAAGQSFTNGPLTAAHNPLQRYGTHLLSCPTATVAICSVRNCTKANWRRNFTLSTSPPISQRWFSCDRWTQLAKRAVCPREGSAPSVLVWRSLDRGRCRSRSLTSDRSHRIHFLASLTDSSSAVYLGWVSPST